MCWEKSKGEFNNNYYLYYIISTQTICLQIGTINFFWEQTASRSILSPAKNLLEVNSETTSFLGIIHRVRSLFCAGFTMVQIIGIVFCGTLISVMSLFFANHLITSPSAKTRKKIEKLELLEAAEIGVGSRRIGGRRAAAYSGTPHVVRTQPGRSRHGSVAPRRIWPIR